MATAWTGRSSLAETLITGWTQTHTHHLTHIHTHTHRGLIAGNEEVAEMLVWAVPVVCELLLSGTAFLGVFYTS